MPEFTAPELQNNFTNTRLLTNITDSSVMLQVYPNYISQSEHKDTVFHFGADDVVFYNDLMVKDKTSVLYNEDTIDNYISLGILSDVVISPTGPSTSFSGVTGSNHIINNKLKKTSNTDKENHLELTYTTDINNKLKLIVYRDTDGISYSLDGGLSSIKTPSTGLLYPAEITSIAIQNAETTSNTGTPKIWLGTLREGLKSYSLGSSTWTSETNLEKTPEGLDGVSGKFLFRRSIKNPIWDDYMLHPENYAGAGTIYRYIAGDYEPSFILGIVNNPISAGIPLVVYVSTQTEGAYGLDTDPRYLTKYLTASAPVFTLDTTYNIYRQEDEVLSTSWQIISAPTESIPLDVLKTTQIASSQEITSNSGVITALSVFSAIAKKACVELLTIKATNHVNSSNRAIIIEKDPTFNTTIFVEANKFSGLSTYSDTVFVTERSKIWRRYNSVWTAWLIADDTIEERNTRITPALSFSIVGSTSYISGFKGFGILKSDVPNQYIGVLNTDLGHLTIALTSTTLDFMSVPTNSKKLRKDLFSTSVRDFQVVPETNVAISCGLPTELVSAYKVSSSTFNAPIRTFLISPVVSSTLFSPLSKKITSLFYKNYKHGLTGVPVLHNKNNAWDITSFNTDQLYTTVVNSETVQLLKDIIEPISYVDSRSFDWMVYSGDSTEESKLAIQLLKNYVLACTKYNRMKLLLRATETVALNNYTLSSDVEFPLVLDFDYQLLDSSFITPLLGYVSPNYVDINYFSDSE